MNELDICKILEAAEKGQETLHGASRDIHFFNPAAQFSITVND